MSTISSLGSGMSGGLDVQSIVDNLMLADSIPVQRLQSQTKTYQSKITAYQALNTKLLALKTSTESILYKGEGVPLNTPADFSERLANSLFAMRKATSSNESIMTATAGKGIVTGSYSVTINRLAKFSTHASSNLSSDTTSKTQTGTITLQKGTETAVPITITAENNSLQGIKNAINGADAGFTATVLNDGSGVPYRLVISSNDSGAANDLTINASWDAVQADPAWTALSFTETTHGQDASVSVNGVDILSRTNAVTNAIEGVTLNLKAESGTATVGTERDADAIVEGVKDFVDKYNAVINYIAAQASYDPSTKVAGVLAGDFTLRETQTGLGSIISQSVSSDSSTVNVLSQAGIKLMGNGTLALDETKFRDKLATNFNDTAHLFLADGLNSSGATTSILPMMQQRLKSLTDNIDGPVFHAQDSNQQSINRINKQIDEMNLRMEARRAMYVAQFTKANEALAYLASMQSSISNQMTQLSKI
jgi:flagellar hook-associated protein 2